MPLRTINEVALPGPKVIEAVRQSCADIPDNSLELAERFYDHLFRLAPSVRSMFADDMNPQLVRMSQALLDVIRHLDRPEEVQRYLRNLGAYHHNKLGVLPEHYPFVGWALVRAVNDLSNSWSSSTSSAWVLVYQWITANMLAGAEEAVPRAKSGRNTKNAESGAAGSRD